MLEAGPRTSMREIQFINDNYYHIYNRGTDKRQIFSDNADYVRFIHYLYGFNDNKIIPNFSRDIEGGPASNIKPRDLLVEIVAFCLMPNHFHLILKQVKDGGITKFMRKLSTGYVMYFNKRNKRSGVLFQGKFKAILIDNDEYLAHLSRYIHINPLEISNSNLNNYRWSSYLDYIGIKNFPSVINKATINSLFPKEIDYRDFISQFISSDLEKINHLILE